jgi:sugar O-acyltransferase (sialic acid O-acetyltransferase NeuD family)
MEDIIIFGTGEYAELAHYYFENDPDCKFNVVAFTADDEYVDRDTFRGLPLVKLSKLTASFPPKYYAAHVALSYSKLNQVKQDKFNTMKELGYELVSYICSKGTITWPDLDIGENCFILEKNNIQPTVKIGDNVMIWSSNHLGHNCEIKDHAYLASGITISGHVTVGERSFIGVNAAFKDFIDIGSDCFITMGANIVKNIPNDSTVTSTDLFESDNIVNKKLKRKYFGLDYDLD